MLNIHDNVLNWWEGRACPKSWLSTLSRARRGVLPGGKLQVLSWTWYRTQNFWLCYFGSIT